MSDKNGKQQDGTQGTITATCDPEKELTVRYEVRITTYGKPDKATSDTTRALTKALHGAFGHRFRAHVIAEGRAAGTDPETSPVHRIAHDLLTAIAEGSAGNAQRAAAKFLGREDLL